MQFKTIAVPSRTSAKKRGPEAAAGAGSPYLPATSAATGGGPIRRGQTHRFAVGQRLAMAPGGRDISRGASTCSVVFLLPNEGGALRYRVRSDNESFERIVDEVDLSPLPLGLE